VSRLALAVLRASAITIPLPGPSLLADVAAAARAQFRAVDGLWGQLLPMSLLFFCMAFVNTLLDAVKARKRLVWNSGGKYQC